MTASIHMAEEARPRDHETVRPRLSLARKLITLLALVYPGGALSVIAVMMLFSGGVLLFFWGLFALMGMAGLMMSLDPSKPVWLVVCFLLAGLVVYLPVAIGAFQDVLEDPVTPLLLMSPLLVVGMVLVSLFRNR